MATSQILTPVVLPPVSDRLRRAVAAYLARFKGQSRVHTESDLRSFITWCEERGLDPLAAQRPHIELYVRWMQEVRRYKPSTISRRVAVVAGFYRTCVIDEVLAHSPAEYVRRPNVPPESPTLGLTHLQFEAMLATARTSSNLNDFALVAMLGLLGLRVFEACGANIEDLGEEHGHRVLKVRGKGGKVVLTPLPPAVSRAIERAVAEREAGPILRTARGTRMDRHCATRRLHRLAQAGGVHAARMHPHMLRHTFVTPCSTPALTCATCRSLPATRTPAPPCATTGPARTWTATPTTSWPRTWHREPDNQGPGRMVLLVVPSSRGVHREAPLCHEGQPEERPLRRPAQSVRALLRVTAHHRWIPRRFPYAVARRPPREHSERPRQSQALPGAAGPHRDREEGGRLMQTLPTTDISHYTYRVTWSVEDQEFVATCLEFPSLSWLAASQVDALTGLENLIAEITQDMTAQGEPVPDPLAERTYSGKFNLRVGEALHRRLAIEAAEEKLSINQLIVRRLNTAS